MHGNRISHHGDDAGSYRNGCQPAGGHRTDVAMRNSAGSAAGSAGAGRGSVTVTAETSVAIGHRLSQLQQSLVLTDQLTACLMPFPAKNRTRRRQGHSESLPFCPVHSPPWRPCSSLRSGAWKSPGKHSNKHMFNIGFHPSQWLQGNIATTHRPSTSDSASISPLAMAHHRPKNLAYLPQTINDRVLIRRQYLQGFR